MKKTITFFLVVLGFLTVKAQLITATGSLTVARMNHGSQILSNGKVITFGGDNGNAMSYVAYNSSELYNPGTGTWSATGSMLKKRDMPASAVLSNGNVLVMGGEDDDYNTWASCEIYNVSSGTWSYSDSMDFARSEARAVTLNSGEILVIGGGSDTCELYDQASNTWSKTGPLTHSRSGDFSAVKLSNGNVLVTGAGTNIAEIYNASTGIWSDVPNNMVHSRTGCTSLLMSNGKVIITGGYNKTSEVFDPSNNNFTATSDMLQYASYSEMVNLTNGKVLIFGIGDMFSPTDKQALQVFNPSSNSWYSAGIVTSSIFGANVYTVEKLQTGKILYIGGNFSTGNGSSSYCYLVNESSIAAGIEELNQEQYLFIYPNPSNDFIEILIPEKSEIEILNMQGQIVERIWEYKSTITVDISDFAKGMYFVKVTNDKGVGVKKFVKE